ncbi:16S rRNA (adenine(1518)-N(6)/adenine(1519)-N(6))-dimethyltransferase RsmA [Woeseiaceae bacterium]|nr:16S rRNA (adenine(1518)-N(6)/adenine(1519)-N(6))-dimethyltransferase RsmA [Woeseiaceae bacterium]
MNEPHYTKKRFGQHFLIDQQIIQAIVNNINPKSSDTIIEIGPGNGVLTKPIAQFNPNLHIIELDRDLIPALEKKFSNHPNISIYQSDALAFDYASIGEKLRLIGNLPYNISTPLMFHLIQFKNNIYDQHFMLQKEVANRLAATPGGKTYGKLTIMFGTYMDTFHLFDVPPKAFSPAPKVISSVVKIKPKSDDQVIIKNPAILSQIVTQAFSQRRKTLRNSLKGLISDKIMIEMGINPTQRAEEIPILTWSKLANTIQEQ